MTLAVTLVTLYICLLVFALLAGKRLVFPMPASSYTQAGADWVQIPYSINNVVANGHAGTGADGQPNDAAGEQSNAATNEQAGAVKQSAAGEQTAKSKPASTQAADTQLTQGKTTQANAQATNSQAVDTLAQSASYVLAEIREVAEPMGYILYQHGNGEDLGMIGSRLQALNNLGWSVLAWEYPGYGLSPGVANEASVSAAMRGVATYARDTLGWPVEETVLYGRSVGGGPSILLANEAPYRGLIAEGTFTSAFRVVTRIKILPIDVFDNWSRIGSIDMPALFLHGDRDFVVPFSHSKKLYASAKEPKYQSWFDGGGHNNLVEDFSEQYMQAVQKFLTNLPEPQQPEAETVDLPPAAYTTR